MTLAVIFLTKDSVYAVADTQTSPGEEGGAPIVTRRTQKLFQSAKHRILFCHSGEGTLKKAGATGAVPDEEVLFTDYILKQFFDHLETLEAGTIKPSELKALLQDYISEHYPDYLPAFQAGVNCYWGGIDKTGEVPTTAIFAFQGGEDKALLWDDALVAGAQLCAFTNCEKAIVHWLNYMGTESPGAPKHEDGSPLSPNEFIVMDACRGHMLTFICTHAANSLNNEVPGGVGPFLDFAQFAVDDTNQASGVFYRPKASDPATVDIMPLTPDKMPEYIACTSHKDFKGKLVSGELKAFNIATGEPATFAIDEKEAEAQTRATVTIQTAFRGFLAIRQLEALKKEKAEAKEGEGATP